jgi:hypothetical protein
MRPPAEAEGVPWFPGCVEPFAGTAEAARAGWAYVLVEEVAGSVAELVRWPWPLADQLGHLFWPQDDPDRVVYASVPVPVLRRCLYEPSDLERIPRAGDTFAAEAGGSGWAADPEEAGVVDDLTLLFPGTVLDISPDAREAAKLAYQGANAAVFSGTEVEDLLAAAGQERGERGPATTMVVASPDGTPGAGGEVRT